MATRSAARRKSAPYGILDSQAQAFAMMVAGGSSATDAYTAVYADKVREENLTRRECGIRAGRVMRRKVVKAEIERLKRETEGAYAKALAEKIVADRQWVKDSLVAVARRCMQAEPVLDRKGNPTGEYRFDSKGANQALALIGKELGMFVERKEVRHGPLADASDAELGAQMRALLGEMAELTGKSPSDILKSVLQTEIDTIDVTPTESESVSLDEARAIAPVVRLHAPRANGDPGPQGGVSIDGAHGTQ
jgi:hypothetical protein